MEAIAAEERYHRLKFILEKSQFYTHHVLRRMETQREIKKKRTEAAEVKRKANEGKKAAEVNNNEVTAWVKKLIFKLEFMFCFLCSARPCLFNF